MAQPLETTCTGSPAVSGSWRGCGAGFRSVLTADGIRIAVLCTEACNRFLAPLAAANQPQVPPELRAALAAITRHIDDYTARARLPRAA